MTHRRAARLLGPLLLSTVLVAPLAPAATAAEPGAGASGIGDTYWPLDGNGGIDVASYSIRNAYDLDSRRLQGRTTLQLTATADLTSFNLDFLLPVSSVEVDGAKAGIEQSAHEVTITPAAPLAAGTAHTVAVTYAGLPGRKSYAGESNWLADDHEVVSMNQPHMAPWWFPANDHPSDKALFTIRTTVPRGTDVVSNGHLLGRTVRRGVTTWTWRADEPMAPYLAFFAAGDFAIDRGTKHGLPYVNAVSRRLRPAAQRTAMRLMKQSSRMVHELEADLGDYPFSTTGGLTTSLPVGFALENQTRPTYPALFAGSDSVAVHELAHQWFGDSVAVARWRDIWLNEGAATFMEWRARERSGGPAAGKRLREWYDARGAGDTFWKTLIADPGADHIFDSPVYERGAMTFQALRNRIGEDAFWTLLRTWVSTKRGGNGTSEEFEALAAQVSGQDLTGFFDAWLRTGTKPAATADNGLG